MNKLFLIYVISQLLSTAYGVTVIESLKPYVKTNLHNDGYVKKNKNSLYKYSDDIICFLKGFIPFYYTFLAVNLIKSKNPIKELMKEEIKNGNYISKEEAEFLKKQEEDNKLNSIASIAPASKIEFEKVDKYVARKSDNSLYDTYISPIEYVIKDSYNNNKLNITPFMDKDVIKEQVVVKEKVSKSDIANAISELDSDELDVLIDSLNRLSNIKKNDRKLCLKDVA